MNNEKQRKAPVLRFKGFTDDWELHKWKNILLVNSGKDYKHLHKGSIPVYGTGGYMLSVDKELSNEDAIGIGRKGTIDHPQYLKAPFWTVDTLFFMTPKKDININFAFALSQTINWKKYDESTGLPSLSKNSINSISVKIPKYNEQKEIGNLISQIEKLLALQQRKLEYLYLIKKSISDKVFNDKVNNFSSVFFKNRIKGKYLFELSNKKGHPELPVLSATQDKGMVFRDSINKDIKYDNVNLNNYKVIMPGDFVVHLRSFQGGFAYSNIIGIASPAYNIFKFKKGISYNSTFWKEKFRSYSFIQLLKKVTYGIRDGRSISFSDFSSLYLNFPDIDIQNKIGACFDNINKQIEIQQKAVKNLQAIKKFLLQNMFI